jgi:hypothetical protein
MSRLEDQENKGSDGKDGLKGHPHRPHGVMGVTIGADTLLYMLSFDNGVGIWNRWIRSLEFFLNAPCTDKMDPPLVADLDFTGGDLRGLNLNGINLDDVWLEKADFTGASLRSAIIGFCPYAIMKAADLSHAILTSDVSAVDFTGAKLENLEIGGFCHYQQGFPPVGLSPDLLSQCREVPDDGREGPISPVGRTIQVGGRLMVMRGRRGA